MLISQFYLRDSIFRLKNLEKQTKENTSVEDIISKFYGICIDIMIIAEESYFSLDDYSYRNIKNTISDAVQRSNDIKDPLELKEVMNEILSLFDEDREYSRTNLYDFTRSLSSAITSYQRIGSQNIQELSKCLNYNNRNLNILDPRCRDGVHLKDFKDNLSNCTVDSYGVEQDDYMSDNAKKNLDRVAKGSLTGSRIINEAFDIMFLEPPITWSLSNNHTGVITKQEKIYLQNTIKYLRPNGVAVIIIPFFKMYKDMCIQISRYFKNVQVRKLIGRDFSDKGLIAIVGQKADNREIDEEIYQSLRRLYNPDSLLDLYLNPLDKYTLPNNEIPIELFRGSVLDMDEMDKIVSSSGCMEAFWKSQEVEKLSENSQRPLLPFNIGQIGLVLTSGCLDGVINEGDGSLHVIKGRVSKKSDINRDVTGENSMEINETISNRVEINVILPNGDYKVLA